VPRLRFTRAEAEAEAIRLATEFVAGRPGVEPGQCVGAVPDSMAARSRCSKHPVAWVVVFKAAQPPGVVMDGGELFVRVNLETNAVASSE
jgi:hypothetical protein